MDALPGAVDAPESGGVIHRLPGRKIVREEAPGFTTTQEIEDSVEELAPAPFCWPTTSFGLGHERLEERPLGVSKVSCVPFSFHPDTVHLFSDTLSHTEEK